MKKIIFVLTVFLSINAKADAVNFVSEYLIPEQLYLVQEGDSAPYTADDGAIVLRFLPNKICSSNQEGQCDGLLLAIKNKSTLAQCVKPSTPYRFDELPVTLNQGNKGVFNVPTITEPTAQTHDYLYFYSNKSNTCYEMSWGNAGNNFDKQMSLANSLIDGGY